MEERRRKLEPFGEIVKSREELDCLLHEIDKNSKRDYGLNTARKMLREMCSNYETFRVTAKEEKLDGTVVELIAFYDSTEENSHYETLSITWNESTTLEIRIFEDDSVDMHFHYLEDQIHSIAKKTLDVLYRRIYREFSTIALVELDDEGHISDVTFVEYNEASDGWLVGDGRWVSSLDLHELVNRHGFVEKETTEGKKLIIKS